MRGAVVASTRTHPANAVSRVRREPLTSLADLSADETREHEVWRQAVISGIGERPPSISEEALRKLVESLGEITTALAAVHGTPDLGNKSDPVDELVYIILSRRTREGAYQTAFDRLKQHYERWEDLLDAPEEKIERLIAVSGLGRRKVRSLRLALGTLRERFGECTLEPTRAWSDEETTVFLCSLPEVGPKSAACVMMCALDRPAFPVDAHVGRVLERVGVFSVVGIDLRGLDHKAKQRELWHIVPPSLRYTLHVNALAHGREFCLPQNARCEGCVIASACEFRRLAALTGTGLASRTAR